MADLEAATEAIKADPRHGSRKSSKYGPIRLDQKWPYVLSNGIQN